MAASYTLSPVDETDTVPWGFQLQVRGRLAQWEVCFSMVRQDLPRL